MTGFAHAIRESAALGGRALSTDVETLDYREWVDRGELLARAFVAHGIGMGSHVAVALPNGVDLLVAYYACARVSAVIIPLSTWSTGWELRRILGSVDVQLLLTSDHFPEQRDEIATLMREGVSPGAREAYTTGDGGHGFLAISDLLSCAPECDDRDFAAAVQAEGGTRDFAILFTSGSTGAPKGVVLTQGAVRENGALIARRMGLGRGDRVYSYFPMFFSGGLCNVLSGAVSVGAEVVTQPRHDAEGAARLIRARRCTARSVWHDGFAAVANAPEFGREQLVTMHKGLVVDQSIFDRFAVEFDDGVNMYGMTETATAFTCHDFRDPVADRRRSHGRVLPGNELRILAAATGARVPDGDEGEIAVRGPRLMKGYTDGSHAGLIDEDGFFHTGDVGRLDGHGRLHYSGRLKTLIKLGGLSVQPEEIEAALLEQYGVARAVVVGDALDAHRLGALVVPRAGLKLQAAELQAALAQRLSKYKVPEIRVIDEDQFVLSATRKVDRAAAARLLFNN